MIDIGHEISVGSLNLIYNQPFNRRSATQWNQTPLEKTGNVDTQPLDQRQLELVDEERGKGIKFFETKKWSQ